MVLGYREYDPTRDGVLEVDQIGADKVDVFFVPPEHSLIDAGLDPQKAHNHRTKLLEIDGKDAKLTIVPICTFANRDGFLRPKYEQVERITLEGERFYGDLPSTPDEILDLLEELPPAFTKNYAFGLGLAKPYRFIIDAVEQLTDCTEIVISGTRDTGPASNGKIFYISRKDFERARRSMNSIGNLAQAAVREVRRVAAYNIFAESMGMNPVEPKLGRHPHRKLFTTIAQGKEQLSEEEQMAILQAMGNHAAKLAEEEPEKLAKLRGDIELVTLETLIQQYEAMLRKKLAENEWQEFFNENPFILNLAFGYPVIKVRDQASVGGRKLSGDGEKITDFLVKNSLTNNTAIFEIKKPQTPVLNKRPFREGVFTPSADLSGSINQALDQKYQFQRQVAQIKENSRLYDIESYAVHCCLVVGTTPESEDRQKSFELFRRNSKDVEIVTFDELLEKLKQLADFLRTADEEAAE